MLKVIEEIASQKHLLNPFRYYYLDSYNCLQQVNKPYFDFLKELVYTFVGTRLEKSERTNDNACTYTNLYY